MLENDGGTLKVSVGSLIESQGSLYVVDTAAFTPTGPPVGGAYLFFDDGVPGFAWSAVAGTFDPTRGGIYDGSDRRQCRFRLRSPTAWDQLLQPESGDVLAEGNLKSGALVRGTDLEATDDATVGGDVFVSGARRPQNTLFANGLTENNIYDIFAPFLPTIGDKMVVWGSIENSSVPLNIAYLERDTATTIGVHGLNAIGSAVSFALTDGGAFVRDIAVAW